MSAGMALIYNCTPHALKVFAEQNANATVVFELAKQDDTTCLRVLSSPQKPVSPAQPVVEGKVPPLCTPPELTGFNQADVAFLRQAAEQRRPVVCSETSALAVLKFLPEVDVTLWVPDTGPKAVVRDSQTGDIVGTTRFIQYHA